MVYNLAMKRAISVIIALIILCPTALWAAEEFETMITRLKDGDSFLFKRIDGRGRQFDECRMLHYNAPEMTGSERAEGIKARRVLARMVMGRVLLMRGVKRDRYGRLLCELRLKDGTYINEEMRKYLKDFPGRDKYLWMEKKGMGI